jgi:hypothetical protein
LRPGNRGGCSRPRGCAACLIPGSSACLIPGSCAACLCPGGLAACLSAMLRSGRLDNRSARPPSESGNTWFFGPSVHRARGRSGAGIPRAFC